LLSLVNDTHWARGSRQGIHCQSLLRRIVGPTTERRALGSLVRLLREGLDGFVEMFPPRNAARKPGVVTPEENFEIVDATRFNFPEADFWPASLKVCSGAQPPGSP